VDVYGAGDGGVGRFGVHDVEEAVDGFVAAYAEEGCAEDFFGIGIDEGFHEAEAFAFFKRAVHAGHGAGGDEGGLAGFAYLIFGEADAGQRRVHIHGIAGNAIGDAARVVVEQVGGDDFVVVVCGVSESAFAVAVAHGVDAFYVGAALVVDSDVPAFIRGNASLIEA